MLKQKTIKTSCSVSGIGLHTGCDVEISFKPAPVNTGIRFIRVDQPAHPVIQADPDHVLLDGSLPRCTSIGTKEVSIHTVEHLMAVLSGLGITNLIIEISAPEVPGLDGCGLEFIKMIKKAGVVEQKAEANVFSIKEPISVNQNGSSILIVPAENFRISYLLDYDHPLLKSQFVQFFVDNKTFEHEIAPCRTFCLEEEAKELLAEGLGRGASTDNALIIGSQGIKNNATLFSDEFARHKVLDFIGDLYLLGGSIRGHVFAVKSGHKLNLELLKKVAQQRNKYESQGKMATNDYRGYEELNIEQIMSVLPHRYPFLLVDRVIEIQPGEKAMGIKNVTINDNFFQGHFPSKPVMPGVLTVEAMAQTAGVLLMSQSPNQNRIALFMAIDKVKFRKPVVPGDQLLMEVFVIKAKSRIAQVRGVAKVGEDIVAEAEMIFTYTDIK